MIISRIGQFDPPENHRTTGGNNPFKSASVGRHMEPKMTFALSLVAFVIAAVVFILPVAALGTPVTDIGMLSTFFVFLLFGLFGLWLHKTQVAEATA
jgi:hypothetical protein